MNDRPLDCYVLEFSVKPGAARQGEVYVHGGLDGLRELVESVSELDAGMLLSYGATLHLWIVRDSAVVEGFDLHPLLSTGTTAYDRVMARIFALSGNRLDASATRLRSRIEGVLSWHDEEPHEAFPLLRRVCDLHDRAETGDANALRELDRIDKGIAEGELPELDGPDFDGLTLDWDALLKLAPALKHPVAVADVIRVAWAVPATERTHSYLNEPQPVELRVGLNDLESGDHYFLADDEDPVEE